ncbi:unnamed protein product [Zymoseptoria tritici ST99CH_3D7]|nr:unnamed protein product [Zymoseptoria tritici ST99CH_3D7]
MIDPATITTWQEGLRCVTKIAAQNAQFAASIKRMIQNQREHETRWYTERQNLKRTQSNRAVSSAKVDSILASLGTSLTKSADRAPEVDKNAELLDFDQKIYAAQQAMEAGMTAELKGLGVPFFGVSEGLVVPDGAEVKRDEEGHDVPLKRSQCVTESEMMELRRRMVKHLEDLYRD